MSKTGPWLKAKAPQLHKFLTRRDRPWPIVRDVLAGALLLLVLGSALYGLTGQPLRGGYPVVVVTTGSMMHCSNGQPELGQDCDPTHWGRLGAIDPGDLVFVRTVNERDDVATAAQQEASTYGDPGDVLVYHRNGDREGPGPPIIHRALFWLQMESGGTFAIPELGVTGATELPPEAFALTGCQMQAANMHDRSGRPLDPAGSGFVTKGDNNHIADQCAGILPARMEWVIGKARGEVPWVGLVNLLVGDMRSGSDNFGHAGSDSKVMFVVVLMVLVASPWVIEFAVRRRRRMRDEKEGSAADEEGAAKEAENDAPAGDEGEGRKAG